MKTCRYCQRDITHLSYKELCSLHYSRQRRGLPMDLKRHDYQLPGYARRRGAKRRMKYSRLRRLYERQYGPIPDGAHIHHLDGNPFNNDPANLIAVSPEVHRVLHRRLRSLQPSPSVAGRLA